MEKKRYLAAAVICLLAGTRPAMAQSSALLADAAEKKDRVRVDALLKKGVDVNAAQTDGMTALHWSVYHDDPSTATLLIKARAGCAVGVTSGMHSRRLSPTCI